MVREASASVSADSVVLAISLSRLGVVLLYLVLPSLWSCEGQQACSFTADASAEAAPNLSLLSGLLKFPGLLGLLVCATRSFLLQMCCSPYCLILF